MRRDDLAGAPVRTEAQLDRYCYRVAGTMGVVMAEVLGVRDRGVALPAAALGMAVQRTNTCATSDEDLANGRVYLPTETIARSGCTLQPGAREALLRDQIARACGSPLLRRSGQ